MAFAVPAGEPVVQADASVATAGSKNRIQHSPIAPVITSWHHTQINIEKFCAIYTIPDFSSYTRGTDCFFATTKYFSAGFDKNVRWCLLFVIKNSTDASDNNLRLFLAVTCSDSDWETYKRYKVNFSLSNVENIATPILNGDVNSIRREFRLANGNGIKNLLRVIETTNSFPLDSVLNPANGLLPDDKLTIVCEVTAATEKIEAAIPSSELQVKLPHCQLIEDFTSLFENQQFGDLTIEVGGKKMLVYKGIVAARSPVFAAMFNTNMKETEQNLVTITDIEYDVVKEMMIYIYTGRSPNVEKMAEDLLIASNKYDVSGLKMLCEIVLCSRLTVENASN